MTKLTKTAMYHPDWNLVADNYQACLDAIKAGYEFSLATQRPGPYADRWADMADVYDEEFFGLQET